MTSHLDFSSVGLGISIPAQPALSKSTSHETLRRYLGDPHEMQRLPEQMSHGQSVSQIRRHQHRRRAQSALIPQGATFEHHVRSDLQHGPRSAMPLQQPFASPVPYVEFSHNNAASMSGMPSHPSFPYHMPSSEPRETVFDRRLRRHMMDSKRSSSYQSTSQYMPSPVDMSTRSDNSPNSGSSYFYMTPSVQTTPFSDVGQFPISETYGHHSNVHTPYLMQSPVEHLEDRHAYLEEMPDTPYIPTATRPIAQRPSNSMRRTTAETSFTVDSNEDQRSIGTSPSSSPPGTPSMKARKVTYSRWTSTEDLHLKDAIAKHGAKAWSLVSRMVPGRTPMQCATRWQGALNTLVHKGRWDPEEDAILVKAVAEWQAWFTAENQDLKSPDVLQEDMYKSVPWGKIAQLLPRPRTGVQALARWSEALDSRITKGKWTMEEDTALLYGTEKYGKCWIKIANCVNGRTQRQCRTRYCQISDRNRKMRGTMGQSEALELHLSE